MNRPLLCAGCAFLLLTLIFPPFSIAWEETDRTPYSIGGFHRAVSTSSPEAQIWFDRGLALSYGFNHEEAIRCFERAAAVDPECAMAYWGIAYASGPNINNTEMEEEAVLRAHQNIDRARAKIAGANPLETALIEALAMRYAHPAPDDRSDLDLAYADAMRDVARAFPDDPDVAALFAESLMMLRPWYHWTPEGKPSPETPEIVEVLESALEIHPEHPGLCHFYIHTMEASPDPGVALPAADSLRDRLPGLGHLVHMPSHIYVLVGDYAAAVEVNQDAIEADGEYVKLAGVMNFYTLYRVHNYHFVVYAAMFDGQRERALTTSLEMVEQIPDEMLEALPDFLEAFVPTPLHVMVRFGMWEEILKQPEPPANQPVTRTVWHYARALAFATTNRVDEAAAEKKAFDKTLASIPDSRLLFNNSCNAILSVADAMLEGEIDYRRGDFDAAFEHLREAVRRDDNLNYDEPWGWMQPARHSLGALLLEQGQLQEAAEVYREDLRRHPKNAWSLLGLAECLERLGNTAEATSIRAQFDEACARSDVGIKASCYCARAAMGE